MPTPCSIRLPRSDESILAEHIATRAAASGSPVSLLLVRVHPDSRHRVRVEALLRDPEAHYLSWQAGNLLAFLRRGDELDAVVWAEGMRMSLQETGVPVTVGIASTASIHGSPSAWGELCGAVRLALSKAGSLGGGMVLTFESLRAASRAA